MKTKICGRCNQEKPLTEFYKHKRDGYRSRCKVCSKLDYKEYINRPERRELFKTYRKEYYGRAEVKKRIKAYREDQQKNPKFKAIRLARNYLRYMVRLGRIIKEPCSICDKFQVEAHHPDYKQPLMIVWLCPDCHRELHYSLKETLKEVGSE